MNVFEERIRAALTNKCPVSFAASKVREGERLAMVHLAIQQGAPLTIREAGAWMDAAEFEMIVQAASRRPGLVSFEF